MTSLDSAGLTHQIHLINYQFMNPEFFGRWVPARFQPLTLIFRMLYQ